jgi:hypothetical protein
MLTTSMLIRGASVSLPQIVGIAAFALTLAAGHRLLLDPNPYMHVVVGRWIIAHCSVPHHDFLSYSLTGTPWIPHEWFAEVVIAYAHDLFGWAGVVTTAAFCFAAALALLCRALLSYLLPSHALIGTALAAGLAFPHFFARPHALSLPILVTWVAVLVKARAAHRPPPIYSALLLTLWANLHPSYPFGLGLAALLAGEALLDASDWQAALRTAWAWAPFGVLSLLAVFATPNGIDGFLLPFRLLHMNFIMSQIQEWQSPNFQLPQPLEPWLMLALLASLSIGIRLPLTRIAMILILLHFALQHQRHAELLGLVTPLLVAPSLAGQIEPYALVATDRRLGSLARTSAPGGILIAGLLVLGLAAAAVRIGVTNEKGPFAPAAALLFRQAQRIEGPVFNDVNFGDYLIYSGISPFIDGRVDMYGDAFLKRYASVEEFPDLAHQYGFTWTILKPNDPHVPLLDHLTGWRRVFADNVAVIHVHD